MVAKPRVVRRDGIRFEGFRYLDPTLASYVGRPVTIRYDPRDITQIRVFLRDRFLCRAVSPEHAGETITLKDIQTARTAHRRALRTQIATTRSAVAEFLPTHAPEAAPPASVPPPRASAPSRRTDPSTGEPHRALRVYYEDLEHPPASEHAEDES